MPRTVALLLLLPACSPDEVAPFATPKDDAVVPADADEAPPAATGPACLAGHRQLDVRLLDTLVRESECPEMLECVSPYQRFAALPEVLDAAEPYADCEAELTGWFADRVAGGAPQWNPRPPEDGRSVGEQIIERSHLGFLFEPDAFWSRPLDVAIGEETIRTSGTGMAYRQREVFFVDPLVGDVRALHLLPLDAAESVATVVVLPGHAEGPEQHRDLRFAQYLPEHGLAAVILNFRAWYMPWDHQATVGLLCQGQSMMMVRAYEAMLAFKYLEAIPEGCGSRLGMLGHSGGSLTANLLAWLEVNPTQALVSDLMSGYQGVEEFQGTWAVDCETHEQLSGLAAPTNDLTHAPIPVRQVPYGYSTANTPEFEEPDPDDLLALDHFVPFFQEELLAR